MKREPARAGESLHTATGSFDVTGQQQLRAGKEKMHAYNVPRVRFRMPQRCVGLYPWRLVAH